MLPAIVLMQAEIDLDKRPPLGPLWFANEVQACFLWRAIGFESIAVDARTDNILPGGRPAPVARNHVIQVQILPIERLSAILTRVLVSFKNIVAGEFDLFLRQMIIDHQQNNAGHADTEGYSPHRFRMRFLLGEIVPLDKAVRLERAVTSVQHSLGMALKQQRQRPSGGANVNRLP